MMVRAAQDANFDVPRLTRLLLEMVTYMKVSKLRIDR